MLINKKSIYQTNVLRDLCLRTNYKDFTDILQLEGMDISITDITAAFNKKELFPMASALELICGKKPVFIKSRRVIQKYNIRKGAIIGARVHLSGEAAYNFLENISFLVLSKQPIDHYLRKKSIDKYGNITFTLRDPLSFFELEREFEKFSRIPEISINISISSNTKEESLAFFSYLNMPFK
jgi:ribosomal protein L5